MLRKPKSPDLTEKKIEALVKKNESLENRKGQISGDPEEALSIFDKIMQALTANAWLSKEEIEEKSKEKIKEIESNIERNDEKIRELRSQKNKESSKDDESDQQEDELPEGKKEGSQDINLDDTIAKFLKKFKDIKDFENALTEFLESEVGYGNEITFFIKKIREAAQEFYNNIPTEGENCKEGAAKFFDIFEGDDAQNFLQFIEGERDSSLTQGNREGSKAKVDTPKETTSGSGKWTQYLIDRQAGKGNVNQGRTI